MRARSLALTSSNRITITVLSAALSSILSCISSQPGDMLLSLMNAQEGEQRRTRDIAKDILRSDRGIRGFFVGIKTRFIHVGVIVTLQLFLYDVVKQLCGIAATGSA
jgi:solute carrier family 25 phosphate transporter 3